jgi:arabinogalactan oligomer/maltooligosaccharide transport system substrate-binding protein
LGEKGQGALKRSITGDNLLSLFTTKKVAFMISGPWQLAELKKASFKWDISPVPGFAGAQPAKPFVGVQALYVATKGKNKAIAQEFATNFFPQTDVAVALYQADPRPPALTSALDQVKATEPNMAKVLDAGKGGDIMPAIPAMATVWDPLGKAEAAIIGGAAVPSTVAAAAKNIQSQIK